MSHEWFNELLPHQNTALSVQMASLRVSSVPTSIDLRTLFGNGGPPAPVPSGAPLSPTGGVFSRHLDPGHFWELKGAFAGPGASPSGTPWKIYAHLSATPSGTINLNAVSGSGVGWPIADGEKLKGRIVGGLQTSPSGGLSPTFVNPTVLTVACPAGAGTGWLHVRRMTLREGQPGGTFGVP